ncbi:MAG: 2'-5' RNA ligase family protein, partial [Candidatus Nanoarchaeia archaeon]
RVIWVGFKDDKHIKMLTSKIDEQLPEFKEDHEFKAHLTIGRVNFVKDKKALVECLKNLKLKPERFAVKEFKLYKSTLTGKGPIYDVISVFSAR